MQMQGPNASMRKSLRSILGMQNQKLSVWTTKGSRYLKSTTGTKNNSSKWKAENSDINSIMSIISLNIFGKHVTLKTQQVS